MSKMEQNELEQRFKALSGEEQKIAAMCLPDEVLLNELEVRLQMVHLLTDKVCDLRKVVERHG